jgi:hypothetical protein
VVCQEEASNVVVPIEETTYYHWKRDIILLLEIHMLKALETHVSLAYFVNFVALGYQLVGD